MAQKGFLNFRKPVIDVGGRREFVTEFQYFLGIINGHGGGCEVELL